MPLIVTCTDHLSTEPQTTLPSNLPDPTSLIALWIAWVRDFISNKYWNEFSWIPQGRFKSIIVFRNGRPGIRENNLRLLNPPGSLLIRFSSTMHGQINFLIKFLKVLPGRESRPREYSFPESSYWCISSAFGAFPDPGILVLSTAGAMALRTPESLEHLPLVFKPWGLPTFYQVSSLYLHYLLIQWFSALASLPPTPIPNPSVPGHLAMPRNVSVVTTQRWQTGAEVLTSRG